MAASTIPAAKRGLLNTIRDRPNLAVDVFIDWTAPRQSVEALDRVFLGEVTDVERVWRLGAGRMDEEYTLSVTVETFAHGDDPQACEERLWEVVHEVEQAIRTDVTLGGAVLHSEGADIPSQELGPADDDTWLARAVLTLRCRAVI